ncbi:MAG: VCBS repeat-containing protein [Candidatus Thiodiazotropha sp.]
MHTNNEFIPQRKLLSFGIRKTCLALGLVGYIVGFSASAANPIVRSSTHAFAIPDAIVENLVVGPAITTIHGEKFLQLIVWYGRFTDLPIYRNIVAGPLDKLFDRTIPWDDLVISDRFFHFNFLPVSNNLVDLNNDGSNTLVYITQEWEINSTTFRVTDDIFNDTSTSGGTAELHFADVDGDGDLDVFRYNYKYEELELYENTGSPEVPHLGLSDGYSSIDDVISQYLSSLPEGFLEYYSPLISQPFPSVYQFPLVYDFDSDGDLDVLVAGDTVRSLKYYEQSIQDGVPVFSEPFGVFPVGDGIASWVADFDNDGDFDLLVDTPPDDELRYYERIGNNPVRFTDPVMIPMVSIRPTDLSQETGGLNIDFDSDGDVDTVNNQSATWNLESSPGSITNFSTRAYVGEGSNILIGGFIIEGQSPQTVILRGIGPSLSDKGVGVPLEDPHIYLFSGDSLIAHNDDWQTTKGAEKIESAGIGLEHLKESALRVRLDPGVYTVHLKGKSGETGMGIIGVDADNQMPTNSLQVNISGRALVSEGEAITIGGFVIEGDTPVKVLIRGLGPQLREQGVSNALSDPNITLYSGSRIIGSNNDWRDNPNVSEIAALDNAPTHDNESAILSELAPGTYTVHLKGGQGELGVGIIAIDRL